MRAALITLGMIGFIALIHELGHFLVAKWSGIKVNVFSIGFGPKLLKKKIGDTEYCLSLIPLGGYVSLEGENKTTGKSNEFQSKPTYIKIAVALAGVTCNFVLAYGLIVYWVHSQGGALSQAFPKANMLFLESIQVTYQMFWQLITGKLAFQKAVGGPILIGYMIHTVENLTFEFVILLTALISLVIGIFNALPIPVLDGGLVVFALLEKVFGKKKIQMIQRVLYIIFFILFIVLTIWVFGYDIVRIVTHQKIF